MSRIAAALVILLGLAGGRTADAQTARQLLQQPTLSRTQIVFVYAGDLWSVPRDGGAAIRLTSGPGTERNPCFSPDGTQVAFTGEYDGNVDVFVIPATGGIPKRLTWHPSADIVLGWTPDGKRILFSSTREAYSRYAEMFTVPAAGGPEEKLPLPMGAEASYSPDGTKLAYDPLPRAFNAWKRYRGGQASAIWSAALATSQIEKLPRDKSNDVAPMWVGDRIYFLSDREGPFTLYSYDVKTKKVARAVDNNGLDMKSASAGPDAIVYEQFGSLHLFDPKTGRTRQVPVTLAGDLPEVREHFVRVGTRLTAARISPTGMRALFETRGEILTVPAEKGDVRNLTNTPGVMEREPVWSPDGRTIAYLSDESGEYMLHLRAQDGTGAVTKIALTVKPSDRASYYSGLRWSPDSKKITYRDAHLGLWYVDVEAKKPVRVDTARYQGGLVPAWAPDSKWIAYAKRLRNGLSAIYVCSLADGRVTQITDGMSDAQHPVFDRDGKYLYFTTSTDIGPALEFDLHAATRQVTRAVYLVVLDKDTPSPLAPESDEEKPADERKAEDRKPGEGAAGEGAAAAKPAASGGEQAKPEGGKPAQARVPVLKIDFDNILQRVLALPMPARRYAGLIAGKAGVLFAVESPSPGQAEPGGPTGVTIHRFDLKARKSDVVVANVSAFDLAWNGEKYLYRQGERWYIAQLRPMATGAAAAGGQGAPGGPGAGPASGGAPSGARNCGFQFSPL